MPKVSTPDFSICKRLAEWRKAQGLTISTLSQALNLSPNAWGHYESGKALPQASKLAALAQLYQIDLNYILTGQAYNPPASALEEAASMAVRFLQKALHAAQQSPSHQPPALSARPLIVAKAAQKTRG